MSSISFQAQTDFQYGNYHPKQLMLGKFKLSDPTSTGKCWLWLSQPPVLPINLRASFYLKLHQYKSKIFSFFQNNISETVIAKNKNNVKLKNFIISENKRCELTQEKRGSQNISVLHCICFLFLLTNFLQKLQNRIRVTKVVALLQERSGSIHVTFLHYNKNYVH